MLDPGLPRTRPLDPDTYGVLISRVMQPDEGRTHLIVVFEVEDPDPENKPGESTHPHKGLIGRTCEAWFDIDSPNPATARAAETQLMYMRLALRIFDPDAALDDLIGACLRVRVARVYTQRDPSKMATEAVEFLPYDFR